MMSRLAVVLALASCTPHRVTRDPAPPIDLPAAFAGAAADGAAAPDRWWRVFGDPQLDALVEGALRNNHDLRAAWARVAQVRGLAGQLDTRLPDVGIGVDVTHADQFPPERFPGGLTTYRAGLQLAYEADLFRRIGSQRDAATQDLAAVVDDTATIAIAIAGEVTTAWLDLRAAHAQSALLAEQLRLTLAQLELLESRLRAGLGATALDIFQQRSLAAQLRAQSVQVAAGEVAIRARLAILLGVTPGVLARELDDAPASLPDVPALPAIGVPADLLVRRPDVRAARRRVEAADWRVASAVAERLPAVRLSGLLGFQSIKLSELFSTSVFSLTGTLLAPLFDNGRGAAKVAQQRAIVEERLAGYAKALVGAATEVESALAGERHAAALLVELEDQVELAADTVTAARERYRDGQIDYLPVLQAIQLEQRLGIALLEARRAHLGLRVQLYRALGGTWTAELSAPERLPLRGSR